VSEHTTLLCREVRVRDDLAWEECGLPFLVVQEWLKLPQRGSTILGR
jgi:hypothetical protein